MEATHIVKDSDNGTIGFVVGNSFYKNETVKEHIKYIDNLTISKSGTIRAKHKLLELDYKDAMIKTRYHALLKENPFERDVQGDFGWWRDNRCNRILQVSGPRQVGKTTELFKFAYKNYDCVIWFKNLIKNTNIVLDMAKYCEKAGIFNFTNNRRTIAAQALIP